MNRFPRPSAVSAPPGARNWKTMYSWYCLFQDSRREVDDELFWFHDSLHASAVLFPYDAIVTECWLHSFPTRVFAIPGAVSVDQRILNGYLYLALVHPQDKELPESPEVCARRLAPYYSNWETSYAAWKHKVLKTIDNIQSLTFKALPSLEPESQVLLQDGMSSGQRLIRNFELLILLLREVYQHHFEMLTVSQATLFGLSHVLSTLCA